MPDSAAGNGVARGAGRTLLIQVRRLGDVTLSTALLENLHRAWPGVAVDWLVGAAAAPLLENHPLLRDRLILEQPHAVRRWREVRARRYDCVIDVQASVSTAAVTWLSGAPMRAGWDSRGRSWAYNYKVPRLRNEPLYVVRDRQRLLGALGLPVEDAAARLHLAADERAWGVQRVGEITGGAPAVGVLLSTSHPSKDWPIRRFAATLQNLRQEGIVPLVFEAPGDAGRVADLRAATATALTAIPPLPLRRLLAMLAACDVFLSADTGPAHMATALGVPRVTLFGLARPENWIPDIPMARGVRGDVANCAGCARGKLDAAHTCMESITPEMVLAPLHELLAGLTGDRGND